MTRPPHLLRLIGGRASGMHTRRVVVERTPVPWALYAIGMWLFAIGWLLADLLPHPGLPIGPLLAAAGGTVLAVRQRRRGR